MLKYTCADSSYMVLIDFEPKRWTLGAVMCYQRGCKCNGCFISETYTETLKERCAMKYCVRELIKKFGLPDSVTMKEILQEEE